MNAFAALALLADQKFALYAGRKKLCGYVKMRRAIQMTLIIISFLANACLVAAGIYLWAHLKKKAEGLATKEEFKDLKEQTPEPFSLPNR